MSYEVSGLGQTGFYKATASQETTKKESQENPIDIFLDDLEEYSKTQLPKDLISAGMEAILGNEEEAQENENIDKKDKIIGGAFFVALGLFLDSKNSKENQENTK